MKKIIFKLLAATIFAAGVFIYFYKSKSTLNENQNLLIVGTNASLPPFEYKIDGEIVGFEIDLMNAIGKQLQKEIVFKDMAFDSLLVETQSGRINMIAAAMTPTEQRSRLVFFTKPFLTNDPLVAITLAKESPKSLSDLKGKEVIVNDGYTAESFMAKQEDIILKRLSTPAESFLALLNGRGYAYVSARSAVQPYFDKYDEKKFNILTLDTSDSYALAVSKSFPVLFEQIQTALNELEKNGTLEALKKKWHLSF
ncbi:MAG: ABC transporter substrate-binding protein [Candidatus Babeliales bacterium]|nr:ABC transporter substrate-binding protein [Candidatus Babeliales bacterium]